MSAPRHRQKTRFGSETDEGKEHKRNTDVDKAGEADHVHNGTVIWDLSSQKRSMSSTTLCKFFKKWLFLPELFSYL